MKTNLSATERSFIILAAWSTLQDFKISHASRQGVVITREHIGAMSGPIKTSFKAFVELITANPDKDLVMEGLGLAWLTAGENETVIHAVRGMQQVFEAKDDNFIKESLNTLRDAMKADQGYAWSWHCNIAMPFMDSGKGAISHSQANTGAAWVMRHLFDVDTLSMPQFKGVEEEIAKDSAVEQAVLVSPPAVFNVTQLDQSNTNVSVDVPAEAMAELVEATNQIKNVAIAAMDLQALSGSKRGCTAAITIMDDAAFQSPIGRGLINPTFVPMDEFLVQPDTPADGNETQPAAE